MPEKGVCLARCTGELHPGPSGWRYLNSEVLELLTFWRAEQRVLIHSGVLFGNTQTVSHKAVYVWVKDLLDISFFLL